jgi:RNA polymerase sigma factor (sigma-70 family)
LKLQTENFELPNPRPALPTIPGCILNRLKAMFQKSARWYPPMSPRSKPEDDTLLTSPTLLARLRVMDDSEAWREFLVRYERMIKGMARARGLSPEDSDDIAQEVFRRVAESIHTFEHQNQQGAFRSWLSQLAKWRVGDLQRQLRKIPTVPIQPPDPDEESDDGHPEHTADSDPIAEFEAATREELVRAALRRLQKRVKPASIQAFELLVIEGLPIFKVASMLQMSPGTLYVTKFRVARQLRDELALLRKELE